MVPLVAVSTPFELVAGAEVAGVAPGDVACAEGDAGAEVVAVCEAGADDTVDAGGVDTTVPGVVPPEEGVGVPGFAEADFEPCGP